MKVSNTQSHRGTKIRKSQGLVLGMVLLGAAVSASAHSIDYVATSISPASAFNGGSGNFTVINPLLPGSQISFTLTVSISTQGNTTTYPATASFTATSDPAGAVVNAIQPCTFPISSATCANGVIITAPGTPGAYSVKLSSSGTDGRGGGGLGGGNGIVINFTVAAAPPAEMIQITPVLSISVGNPCMTLHAPTTSLTANLTANGTPLVGKTITFSVEGAPAGQPVTAVTDVNGVATTSFNTGLLTVGDHIVTASYAGETVGNTEYIPIKNTATLSVIYNFIGFQQPINGDGSSVFNGKVVPVKIKIGDDLFTPVTNATASVFYAKLTDKVVGSDPEAAGSIGSTAPDGGNTMRYDPLANQYVFNWDTASLASGAYRVQVGLLNEGSCALPHTVVLSLGKKK